MKKLVGLMLVFVVALTMVSIPTTTAQEGTILEVAEADGSFTTLVTAVSLADPALAESLGNPDAEFTVFAPNDAAFALLPEAAVEAAIGNQELLSRLLSYHVVEGVVMSGDLAEGENTFTTLAGDEIVVTVDDMGVRANSADVVTADLEASNGVIHVIDSVMVPPTELPAVDPIEVSGDIITAGSSTVGPLSVAMAQRWSDEGGADVPTVDIIGSGAGFERFCVNAETDISNASRPIKESEIAACAENDRLPIEFRVGTDAIAVTVSTENDFVDNLSLEELAAVFSGEAATWADINPEWPEETIELYSPGTDSGTFDFFVEVVLEEDPEPLLGADPQLSEDDNVLVEGIQGSPYAIGYFGYAYYLENTDTLRILSLDDVTPNASTVESGAYALARPLFIYSDADIMNEKPQVASFIAYYLNNVNEIIGEVGYFPPSNDGLNLAKLQWLVATGNL
jgi:phosphate transport system substrate-binding protein